MEPAPPPRRESQPPKRVFRQFLWSRLRSAPSRRACRFARTASDCRAGRSRRCPSRGPGGAHTARGAPINSVRRTVGRRPISAGVYSGDPVSRRGAPINSVRRTVGRRPISAGVYSGDPVYRRGAPINSVRRTVGCASQRTYLTGSSPVGAPVQICPCR